MSEGVDLGGTAVSVDGSGPRRVPLTRLRRAIAKSMAASAAVPQFTIEYDVPLGPASERRERWRAAGMPVSVADLLTASTARALRAHPRVNASFEGDAILEHQEINIGLAVALDDGLIAPAVRNADRLTLIELAAERRRLTDAATSGALTPEEVLSATFTISNLGPFGVSRFRALVVPPQAAILAVGGTRPDGSITLSLSCDHRVLDGAPAAEFLRDVAGLLAVPDWFDDILSREDR